MLDGYRYDSSVTRVLFGARVGEGFGLEISVQEFLRACVAEEC